MADNLSTDSDIIRELDSLKLDEVLIGTGSPISKKPKQKISQTGQRRNSRRRSTQMQRLTIPLEDLLNDSGDSWSQPASPSTATSTSLALVEARINTYANNAFNHLKEDFAFDLRELFESRDQTDQIINSFVEDLSRHLRSEISLTSEQMKLPEISFDLEISLPETNRRVFPSLRPSISEFAARRDTFAQDVAQKISELESVCCERDKYREKAVHLANKNRKAMDRIHKAEADLNALDQRIERHRSSLMRKRTLLEREMDALDAREARQSEGDDFKKLFNEELSALRREIHGIKRKNSQYAFVSKINAILNESVDIKRSRESLMQAVLKVNDSLCLFPMNRASPPPPPPRRALTPIPNQRSPFSPVQKCAVCETPRRQKRNEKEYFVTPNRERSIDLGTPVIPIAERFTLPLTAYA